MKLEGKVRLRYPAALWNPLEIEKAEEFLDSLPITIKGKPSNGDARSEINVRHKIYTPGEDSYPTILMDTTFGRVIVNGLEAIGEAGYTLAYVLDGGYFDSESPTLVIQRTNAKPGEFSQLYFSNKRR